MVETPINHKDMTEGVWGCQKQCSLLRVLDIVWALYTREDSHVIYLLDNNSTSNVY